VVILEETITAALALPHKVPPELQEDICVVVHMETHPTLAILLLVIP
jgi:hypothetical protein